MQILRQRGAQCEGKADRRHRLGQGEHRATEMGGGPGMRRAFSLEMTHFHLLSEGTELATPWTGVSLPGTGWLGGSPVVLGRDISAATSKL